MGRRVIFRFRRLSPVPGNGDLLRRRRLAAPHNTWPVIARRLRDNERSVPLRRLSASSANACDGRTLHRRINFLNRSTTIDS